MKRKIAYLLAAVLTFSSVFPVYATDSIVKNTEEADVRQQSQTEATPSDGEEKPDEQDKVTPDSENQDSPDKEQTDKGDIQIGRASCRERVSHIV